MKQIFIIALLYSFSFANILNMNSFEANFTQTVTDEKGKTLTYSGSLQALKPQFALWVYAKPVEKRVYISGSNVTIVEPELEQVLLRRIQGNFDFFSMIKNAKKIDENNYIATFQESKFDIEVEGSQIISLSYKDNFDNDVKIIFSKQVVNSEISQSVFEASYPSDYDVIKD